MGMLDVEYIAGVAPGIKTQVWSYKSMAWCTDIKNWTTAVLDSDNPPSVFSVSYGVQGNVSAAGNEGCNAKIVQDIDEDFCKMAARGISVLVSSGDDGRGSMIWPLNGECYPSWPASSPCVTAVGATMFIDNEITKGERATTQFGSGGGFYCDVPMPEWQKNVVQAYLENKHAGLPRPKDFCSTGRATPDLAALGEGYQVMIDGNTMNVGGTSASSPLVAGLISLLNEHRLQNSGSPLGFLNPLLYQMGQNKTGFFDVTVGNNKIGDMSIMKLGEGFDCTEGWDAVTGFGTPVFGQMLNFVKQLPSGARSAAIVV